MSQNRINSINRYVALDVETTGLSPKKRIPWQVRQVHGITNEMLYGEPKPDEVTLAKTKQRFEDQLTKGKEPGKVRIVLE